MKINPVMALLSLIIISGCGTIPMVTKRPGADLVPKATITVVSRGVDVHNVHGQIEEILFRKGYNVVSEQVARDQIKIETDAKSTRGHANVETSVSRVKEIESVYFFSYSYSTRTDFPNGEVFTSFTGSVVDLRNGQLVASLRFSQGVFGSTSIATALEKLLKDL